MKVSHLPMAIWVTRLVLGISILSDAMVLQQIELVKFAKVAEALRGFVCNGFKRIFHDLRSSVI